MNHKQWLEKLIQQLRNYGKTIRGIMLNDSFGNSMSSYEEVLKAQDILKSWGIRFATYRNVDDRMLWQIEGPFPDFIWDESQPIPWPDEPSEDRAEMLESDKFVQLSKAELAWIMNTINTCVGDFAFEEDQQMYLRLQARLDEAN